MNNSHISGRVFSQRGFTLLEMVITIVILSVVGGILAMFIRQPISNYQDTVRRAELSYQAEAALQKMSRDVSQALPNSVRITGGACVEYIPVQAGGRYRAETSAIGVGDVLNFALQDSSFDVLTADNLPNFMVGGPWHVVVYNLGVPGSDAYQANVAGNNNRASLSSSSTATKLTLTSANQFPDDSPSRRFFVIPNYSVVYSCAGGKLWRSTRTLSSNLAPLSSCPSSGAVVAGEVSNCSFDYLPATFQNLGQLTIRLSITREDETVSLYRELYVANTP